MNSSMTWCMGKEYYSIPEIHQMQECLLVPGEFTYKVKGIQLLLLVTENQPLQFLSFTFSSGSGNIILFTFSSYCRLLKRRYISLILLYTVIPFQLNSG
jgi:hypothetical protein